LKKFSKFRVLGQNGAMSQARYGAVLIAFGAFLLAPACAAPGPPTTSTANVPEVSFAERQPGGEHLLSEIRGELILDDEGCLRVRTRSGARDVVVWPADFKADEADGEVRVLDSQGRVVARVGEAVYMGGGESPVSDNEAVDERTRQELRERCPGTYWIAAPPVRIPRT
jgi:hypothetical protein